MIHKTLDLGKNNATLTTYILDFSDEMADMVSRKAILILPGGGYQFCSDREAEPIALAYNKSGFNAFILRYTCHEEGTFEDSLRDAKMALKMIRKHAKDWHVNDNHIAVIGFSAGGHLAAHLSTNGDDRPNACILGYPAILKEKTHWPYPTPTVDSVRPPTFLFHTDNDDVCPVGHSLYYANKCDQYDIPFELHIFQDGPHGLSLGTPAVANKRNGYVNDRFQAWFELSLNWLSHLFG
ncbi:MAG: alpha/beta hydrolase [Candidatus Izemoplasma sp.]|nr:alpha/beta hydrolase [Candidatus Izemoplasma sp.]